MSDELCSGIDDSDGLTTLKLLELLVCSGVADSDEATQLNHWNL